MQSKASQQQGDRIEESSVPGSRALSATQRGGRGRTAFTLLELLVVIAIIGVLAALLMPTLLRSLGKARQTVCLNHQRQLALGFLLYHADSEDIFPGCASKRTYGPQPEDWIWWQQDRDPAQSALARYVARFQADLFRCPADRAAARLQPSEDNDPYRYSYSLTSYDLEGELNLGMGSIYTKDTPRKAYPFKATSIHNPSGKLMLVEEARSQINDGRWIPNFPSFDPLSERHGGRANVVFADGHAEAVLPAFGTNAAHSLPHY